MDFTVEIEEIPIYLPPASPKRNKSPGRIYTSTPKTPKQSPRIFTPNVNWISPSMTKDDSIGRLIEKFDALAIVTPVKREPPPKFVIDISESSDSSISSNDSHGHLHGISFNRTLRELQKEEELNASPILPKLSPKQGRVYPQPPKFYFPQGKPIPLVINDAILRRVCDIFKTLPGQKCRYEDMEKLCKAAELPLYWKKPVFKCMAKNDNSVSVTDFTAYWRAMTSVAHDEAARFVYTLTGGMATKLHREHFRPMVFDIIHTHPGLAFYKSSVEFHDKYCDVVVTRIFWNHIKTWAPYLTVDDIRRGDLLENIKDLEVEEDINKNREYFSYEHFYVIYCLFWEIDTDHDLKIRREDLQCHMKGAIPKMVIERIFSPAVCKQSGGKILEIGLVEFTQFLLADEDKHHPSSVEYWFRILDEDDDGIISLYDMENYYSGIQLKLSDENIESMKFSDVVCHLIDAIHPKQENAFRRIDLKRSKLAPRFFNSFVNWRKFFEQETTEGSVLQIEGQELTDWDRFCIEEYEALEEDQGEDSW